ncbi:MAG: vWA domain-containing protein, partial [Candidatus Binatia bacterium]
MQWGHFDNVFWYFLLPLLWLVLFFYGLWRRRAQRALADPELLPRILPGFSPWWRAVKTGLKVFALMLVILALMEPKWGTKEEEVTMRGVDLMVLVDVSNSMLAQDVPPSRMERVKRKFRDLIPLLAGDRVGLIAFAGRSFLLAPLTIDYGTLELYVDELTPATIPVQGT